MNELFKDCHVCTHLDFATNPYKSINLKYQPWSSSHFFFHHVLKRKGSPDQQVPTPWTVQLWTSRMCHHWSGLWHRETTPMVKTSPSTKYGDLIPMTDPYVWYIYICRLMPTWLGFLLMANGKPLIWHTYMDPSWDMKNTMEFIAMEIHGDTADFTILQLGMWDDLKWFETGTHGPWFFFFGETYDLIIRNRDVSFSVPELQFD